MVLVVDFCVMLDMLFVRYVLRFLGVGMMFCMGDGNGICLVGNSRMNLYCFLVSVRSIVGSNLLLCNCISLDLFRRSFLYDSYCFLYEVRLF